MSIKILVNGAKGKMGSLLCKTIQNTNDLILFGESNSTEELKKSLHTELPDIVVDLTTPNSVFANTNTIIQAGINPIIGTSGLTVQQIGQLQKLCEQKKLGGIIAPNFSLGAVLMIKCSKLLAKTFSKSEIIEMHHDHKLDKPSATAIQTANIICEVSSSTNKQIAKTQKDIPIHSIRLPGLLAHQQVIFGNNGETLTIKHDTISRECFMPGIIFACKEVGKLNNLVYGLENLI
ncbi:MAG: 4-hydroxy-tetrahydrodipicolinate reductase [Legionellales bacterium]|nr:4-hydroxy-tetrahydrodipicolinate reductase [Legionellales bacterium]